MQHAYDSIRAMMLSGELQPGTRLVNRALGAELGLSTVTVREAIHRLTSEGLVDHVPNAGAYVRRLDQREIGQLYEFRKALERFALEVVVRRIETYELRNLEQLCEQWRAVADEIADTPERRAEGELFERWWQCDARFHAALIDAAANTWLSKTIHDLQLMSHIAATKPRVIDADRADATVREHAELLDALRDRDLDAALAWLDMHYRNALDRALRDTAD